jgi:colanic acid biosynthesis glycosyl transferase WcaI
VFLLLFRKKYDIVIAVAPPFQLGLIGWLYKTLRGIKFIYHIQDLQIDAAKELGLIKSPGILKLMLTLERFILRNADHVSTISEGMQAKVKAKVNRPIHLFPNWADTDVFFPVAEQDEAFRCSLNLEPGEKIVLYSGAIGEKQGLEALLEAAKTLEVRPEIKIVICGSGPYKENLIKLAGEMSLTNVIFMPLQPKEDFNRFLNLAHLHLVLQKANASDLVMPSKLTTILAVGGLALVSADKGTSLYKSVNDYNMGMVVEPENVVALADAVVHAIDHPYTEQRNNARQYAENYLNIDRVMARFLLNITNQSWKASRVTALRKKAIVRAQAS